MFTAQTLERDRIEQLTSELDVDTVFMILENFLKECQERLTDMKTAALSKDFETLAREAHSMKSSSASFGAMQLSELGLKMEQAFRQGQNAEGIKLMDDHLEDVTKEAIEALSAWKQEKAA